MAARLPIFAFSLRTSAISFISSVVTKFTSACRSSATLRAYGLPGPPGLPGAKRPLAPRPVLGFIFSLAVLRSVTVLMALLLLRKVDRSPSKRPHAAGQGRTSPSAEYTIHVYIW